MTEVHNRATRRLILCLDGTWFNAIAMTKQVKDNVLTVATAVLPQDSHGVPQLVMYQGGVGTGLGLYDRLFGAATGDEIRRNVRDAYLFIVNNWTEGAEIYMFGWSRGAYTARVVSGLISEVGLLRKTGLEYFGPMFDAFFNPKVVTRSVVPESQFHRVKVECLGLWETVGSLGIPDSQVLGISIPIVNRLLEKWNNSRWYRFEETALPSTSKIGLQAFGIDESLRFLSPTLWTTSSNSPNILKQVWFPGLHATVSGGYAPHAFGDISLNWMVSEVATLTDLEFDKDFLLKRFKENVPIAAPSWGAVPEPPYPLLADRFAYRFGPKLKRTPGNWPPLGNGIVRNEFYHHSVAERISGTLDNYPSGRAVVQRLEKLPYTKMERDFAMESGLVTEAQIQAFWEV